MAQHHIEGQCRAHAPEGSWRDVRSQDEWKEADAPGSLVLPVASLNNLVFAGQDFLLEDLGTPAFVHASDFEDLGRVHIGIRAPAHHCDVSNHAFVHLGRVKESPKRKGNACNVPAQRNRPHCKS